jgi:peptide/nickel transport system substrate-binding protein
MLAKQQVLEAIYDGPFDQYAYEYHPVILEKLPSLADGDAVINVVDVNAGDMVVNVDGAVVPLANGERVFPAGCRSSECAVSYSGGSLQMEALQVTFTLLPGLTWSDGTPLTAYDSMYSYSVAASPDTPNDKYLIERTAYYYAVDDLRTIWAGLPGFLDQTYYINFWSPLPQHVLSRYTAGSLPYADLGPLLLGWGPYIFQRYDPGYSISFTRNPQYFRAAEGLPVFSDLVYRFIGTDSNSAVSALLAGECDILGRDIALDGSVLIELESAGALDAILWSNLTWEHADFNIRPHPSIVNTGAFAGWDQDRDGQGPFGDVRLRRAVAACMDRQAVVDTLFYGAAELMNILISPDHPLLAPDLPHVTFDPALGQQLLDDIGWLDTDNNPATPRVARNVQGVPNGTPLSFYYETTTATLRQQATQILAESLWQCGIQANLNYYPASEWFADGPDGPLFGRRFDLGQFAWVVIDSALSCDLYLSTNIPSDEYGWGGQNETGYQNPNYDAACNQYLQTLPGEPGYVEAAWEFQYYLANDLPVVPLYTRINLNATRPDFCFFTPANANDSEFWNLEAFDYGDACP